MQVSADFTEYCSKSSIVLLVVQLNLHIHSSVPRITDKRVDEKIHNVEIEQIRELIKVKKVRPQNVTSTILKHAVEDLSRAIDKH